MLTSVVTTAARRGRVTRHAGTSCRLRCGISTARARAPLVSRLHEPFRHVPGGAGAPWSGRRVPRRLSWCHLNQSLHPHARTYVASAATTPGDDEKNATVIGLDATKEVNVVTNKEAGSIVSDADESGAPSEGHTEREIQRIHWACNATFADRVIRHPAPIEGATSAKDAAPLLDNLYPAPLPPYVRDELVYTCMLTLMAPSKVQQTLSSASVDVREPIMVLECFNKGSETYMENVARTLATHFGADFLAVHPCDFVEENYDGHREGRDPHGKDMGLVLAMDGAGGHVPLSAKLQVVRKPDPVIDMVPNSVTSKKVVPSLDGSDKFIEKIITDVTKQTEPLLAACKSKEQPPRPEGTPPPSASTADTNTNVKKDRVDDEECNPVIMAVRAFRIARAKENAGALGDGDDVATSAGDMDEGVRRCILYIRDFPTAVDPEDIDILYSELEAAAKLGYRICVIGSHEDKADKSGDQSQKEEKPTPINLLQFVRGDFGRVDDPSALDDVLSVQLFPKAQTSPAWTEYERREAAQRPLFENHRKLASCVKDAGVVLRPDCIHARGLDEKVFSVAGHNRIVAVAVAASVCEETPVRAPAHVAPVEDGAEAERTQDAGAAEATAGDSVEISRAGLETAITVVARGYGNNHECDQEQAQKASEQSPPLTSAEQKLLPNLINPSNIKTRFSDIGSNNEAKDMVQNLISLPLKRPELFAKGLVSRCPTGILLFGPPGTGKTMIAKAVAKESGSNFLHVSMGDIMDRYVGEGEKNARAAFTLARRNMPCVIFLDEVDSLFASRNDHNYNSKTEVLNQFMSEWDGLTSEGSGRVIVMAATNRPNVLDDAVLRRLPRRVLIDLPNAESRLEVLKIVLKDENLSADVDLEDMVKKTEGYSGSDLHNLCLSAALTAVKTVADNTTAPPDAAPRESTETGNAIPYTISNDDFGVAFKDVKKSTSSDMSSIQELRKWDKLYGSGSTKPPTVSLGF